MQREWLNRTNRFLADFLTEQHYIILYSRVIRRKHYAHLYEPYVFWHTMSRSAHLSGDCWSSGSEHSSTSTHVFQSLSSCKPSGHTQNADPVVFIHWCEHPAVPSRHSSTSSQVCPSPASLVPGMSWHEHLYPPQVLKHVPWHGPCPLRNKHSSMSV